MKALVLIVVALIIYGLIMTSGNSDKDGEGKK
jgi:hypothetical protein